MTDQTFVIVGCGAAKREQTRRHRRFPAKDLYTSNYFALKRRYAEAVGDQWMILSAKHGLIPPLKHVAPYDTTIGDLREDELDELAHAVGIELIEWTAWGASQGRSIDRVVVLAGRSYLDPLRERETFNAGIEPRVEYPLQQNRLGGIGEQMAWLKERVKDANQRQTTLAEAGR